jgi:diaminopimelate decarboxylase
MPVVPINYRLASETNNPTILYDIVGPVCETGDWLGRDRDLDYSPEMFWQSYLPGAYGSSMASNYNTPKSNRNISG